jgi:hypothetical protein
MELTRFLWSIPKAPHLLYETLQLIFKSIIRNVAIYVVATIVMCIIIYQEHEALQAHCQQLQQALEEQSSLLSAHQESNAEMQRQLDEATDPERLQSIRTRMERYKQERDTARSRIEDVEKELVMYQSEQEMLTKQLQEASHQSEIRLIELQLKMTQQEKSLAKTADYETRMRRYRDERNKAVSDNHALRKQFTTLENSISDLFAKIRHQDTSDDSRIVAEIEALRDPGQQNFPPELSGKDRERGHVAATRSTSLYGTGSTTASRSTSVEVSAAAGHDSGGPSEDETIKTSSVQFMWQPLSDIDYPTITLLASFTVSENAHPC